MVAELLKDGIEGTRKLLPFVRRLILIEKGELCCLPGNAEVGEGYAEKAQRALPCFGFFQ